MKSISDEQTLIKTVNKKTIKSNNILIGFSGGLDSTVLLHILTNIRKKIRQNLKIRAIYINHKLQKNSYHLIKHCKKICLKWNVDFLHKSIQINQLSKFGIQAEARHKRYEMFKKHLIKNEVIVTAQHLDDQAETFILALKRGSGPSGLSCMPAYKNFANSFLIRPLLNFSKNQLFLYAKQKSLIWIEDQSNCDTKYDRNFIRLEILKKCNMRWLYFSKSINKSAKLCSEQENLISELLEDCISKITSRNGELKIKYLKKFSKIKTNAIIRRWIKHHNFLMPSYNQISKIRKNIIFSEKDSQSKIIFKNYIISHFKEKLYIFPKFKDIRNTCIEWNMNYKIKLPDNLGFLKKTKNTGTVFRTPMYNEKVTIRFMIKEKIKIPNYNSPKTKKKIWQKFNIPPWLRNRIPLIYYNNTLIAAIGIFVTEQGKVANKKSKIKIKWIKNKIL